MSLSLSLGTSKMGPVPSKVGPCYCADLDQAIKVIDDIDINIQFTSKNSHLHFISLKYLFIQLYLDIQANLLMLSRWKASICQSNLPSLTNHQRSNDRLLLIANNLQTKNLFNRKILFSQECMLLIHETQFRIIHTNDTLLERFIIIIKYFIQRYY